MKIAVTAHGQTLWSPVDSRFGRADNFILYDLETDAWDYLPNNQNLKAAHGAGIQAGQILTNSGAGALISGHVGPKAFKVLAAAQIAMYSLGEMNGTVEEVVAAYRAGKLAAISEPGK